MVISSTSKNATIVLFAAVSLLLFLEISQTTPGKINMGIRKYTLSSFWWFFKLFQHRIRIVPIYLKKKPHFTWILGHACYSPVNGEWSPPPGHQLRANQTSIARPVLSRNLQFATSTFNIEQNPWYGNEKLTFIWEITIKLQVYPKMYNSRRLARLRRDT